MPELDVENDYETDSSDNEESHSKLLSSVSQLDSTQRIKPAQRKEIATEVSEYNLNKGIPVGKKLINVTELIEVLGKKPEHEVIAKKIKNVTKKFKVLPKPLEKPMEERLKRAIGFGKVKKELRKWDAIVTRNALKDQIRFPLNDKSMKIAKSTEFLSQFTTPTQLEVDIAKVLNQEEKKEKDSDQEEFPLTLEEMREKRREMAQLRAKLSYSQVKAKRQGRIKSKKYHRLLKREKLKQQLKEFELLQKTDPEAALKKLAELDKTRAKERASLRHRNTGKWAKNLTVRAKYDVQTRKVLAEQLKMSRELTQKVAQQNSSEDEETVDPVLPEKVVQTSKHVTDNPWMLDVSKEVQDFVSGFKKFWNEKEEINRNESKEKEKKKETEKEKEIEKEKETEKEEEKETEKEKRSHETEEVINQNKTLSEKKLTDNKEIRAKKISERPVKTKSTKKKKISPKKIIPKEKKTCVSIHSASGVWIVTPITEEPDLKKKNKRKTEDIDTLFDELNDKLMRKAKKKVSKIKKILKNKEKKVKQEKQSEKKKSEREFDLSLKSDIVTERPDTDMGLLEGGVENDIEGTVSETIRVNPIADDTNNKADPSIDPTNFIQLKPKKLNTLLPDNITGDEDGVDDEKAQKMIIEEAFEDDDVMAEFNELKKQEEEKNKVEFETSLPGWGLWGGTGIAPTKRKKRLFKVNLPPIKKKIKKEDVIINENENPNLKKHLVKEVPHPFKSVEAFEANIRAPVGRDWMPETAHRKLIQKQVVTKLGTIIEPMSEDEIVRLKKAEKSPYKGKKKKAQNSKN